MSICFVDSTTLLYPLDESEPTKQRASEAWLKSLRASRELTISQQVLNECYWVVLRKARFERARPMIRTYLTAYRRWVRAPLDPTVLTEAWRLEDAHGIRFWDALLLASANAAGCDCFLSEDLNDGQRYGAVTAINPFLHAPEDVLGRALR